MTRPYLSSTRRRAAYWRASVRARAPRPPSGPSRPSFAFIIGCGRSGTTLLGDLLRPHPDVAYLFEPFVLWAAIDPRTDVGHLYTNAASGIVLDEGDWSPEAQARFHRLFIPAGPAPPWVIEKSPRNTMRIGYLQRLAPGCRFVHIVRSGPDVARSIARFAEGEDGERRRQRRPVNGWWGVGDAKWKALCHDAERMGGLPSDMATYGDHVLRGACEWVMSLDAVSRRSAALGGDLLEVRYEDLTAAPAATLLAVAAFLGLEGAGDWVESVRRLVRPHAAAAEPLRLPAGLAALLNRWQEHYGFEERALVEGGA